MSWKFCHSRDSAGSFAIKRTPHRYPSIRPSPRHAAAINHARQFGESTIHLRELDGDQHVEVVEPDFRAPTPADVKGRHVVHDPRATNMRVTIIGTGRMGRAIGTRALAGGHEVDFIGTHISKAR